MSIRTLNIPNYIFDDYTFDQTVKYQTVKHDNVSTLFLSTRMNLFPKILEIPFLPKRDSIQSPGVAYHTFIGFPSLAINFPLIGFAYKES